MIRYIISRLGQAVLVLIGISLITFLLTFLVPADPARMIAGRLATPETVARIRAELGLDQPLPVQYGRYLWNLLHGDLGRSYAQRVAVTELLLSRLPATFQLMVAGIFAEVLLGIPRSEEHTSELQSRENLVCRLLPEKKNPNNN